MGRAKMRERYTSAETRSRNIARTVARGLKKYNIQGFFKDVYEILHEWQIHMVQDLISMIS